MKKLLYIFVILIVFSACDDEYDYTFDKTPTERKSEANNQLANLLSGSEFGWKTTIVVHGSKTSAGDYFLMKFAPRDGKNSGVVTVANLFDSADSEFQISHEAGTILCFNTYNEVFYWLTKPNSWEGGGFGSDLEFIFMREEGDKLIFQGKEKENEMILEKATEQDWTMADIKKIHDEFMQEFSKKFVALKVTKGMEATEENPFYAKFNNGELGSTKYLVPEKLGLFYQLTYDVDGEKEYGNEASFVFTANGVILSEPVVIKGDTLDRLVYNEQIGVWEIANEGVVGYLESSDLPLMPSPGAVDNLLNIFLQDDYGWEISPWNFGDEGKMEEFADGILNDCEMFDWFKVHANYSTPEGVHLGAGFELQGDDWGDTYAFIPVKFEKLGESEFRIVRDGDIVTNIEGAEDVIATDPNIQAMLNSFCNETGWSIFYQSYFYTPTREIYTYEFYNMEDPSIIMKKVWGRYY